MVATMQLDVLQQQAMQAEKEHEATMAALQAQASSLRQVIEHVQQDLDCLPAASPSAMPEGNPNWTWWLEERCKHATAVTSKLNATHRTLKMQLGVLQQQLAAVQHETVKEIDLEQLRIENASHQQKSAQAATKAADARRSVSAAIEVVWLAQVSPRGSTCLPPQRRVGVQQRLVQERAAVASLTKELEVVQRDLVVYQRQQHATRRSGGRDGGQPDALHLLSVYAKQAQLLL